MNVLIVPLVRHSCGLFTMQMASFLGHPGAENCAIAWLQADARFLQDKTLLFPVRQNFKHLQSALGVRTDYEGHEVEWMKVSCSFLALCTRTLLSHVQHCSLELCALLVDMETTYCVACCHSLFLPSSHISEVGFADTVTEYVPSPVRVTMPT